MELFLLVLFSISRNSVVSTDDAKLHDECSHKPMETYKKHHKFCSFKPKESILLLVFSGEFLLTVDLFPSLLVLANILLALHKV